MEQRRADSSDREERGYLGGYVVVTCQEADLRCASIYIYECNDFTVHGCGCLLV